MPLILGQHVDHSYYGLDHRFTALEAPAHPSLRQLIALWRGCDAKDGMRMGRDIPRAIAPFLSQIMIYEPVANWEDAMIRYAGFGMAKYFGGDVTGRMFSALEASDRGGTLKQLFSEARGIVAENRCRVLDHRVLDGGIEVAHQELVTFPIFGPDGQGRWILSAAFDL